MTVTLISTVGLLLCLAPAAVHGVEWISPMFSRWIVRFVLPFFGPGLPSARSALTYDEQLTMLDAATAAGPADKPTASRDYVFLMLFEGRQGSIAFVAVAVGILFALTLPLADRTTLHLLLAVVSVLFTLVNANQGGLPFLGHHPRVSRNGRHVGWLFTPFWALSSTLNVLAFLWVGA